MTYRAEQLLQPRSFVLSGNEECMTVQSTQNEARITFLNSMSSFNNLTPRYAISMSNMDFNLTAGTTTSNVAASFRPSRHSPNEREVILFGSTYTSNLTLLKATTKGIILDDPYPTSSNVFSGFGVEGDALTYQLPSRTKRHVFRAAAYDGANVEWVRIQESGTGVVQVGIGTTTMAPTEALAVKGDTVVTGNLRITGQLNLSNSPFIQRNPLTNRIDPSVLTEGVVLLTNQGKIDESVLPQRYNFQYLRAQKNVGIGTRIPAQKLHVWGSTVISERLGIGTTAPISRVHVVETSAVTPAVMVQNLGGGDGLWVQVAQNTVPALVVKGTHNGVGIGTSLVDLQNSLEVGGNARVSGQLTCANLVLDSKVTANDIDISSPDYGLVFRMEVVPDQLGVLGAQIRGRVPFIFERGLTTNFVKGYDKDYVHFRNVSVLVDLPSTFIGGVISGSDMRHKYNIERISDAASKLSCIRGYTYQMGNRDTEAGVLAQEVLRSFPEAVCTKNPDFYGVKYNSIIALLLEGYHDLNKRLRAFEACGK